MADDPNSASLFPGGLESGEGFMESELPILFERLEWIAVAVELVSILIILIGAVRFSWVLLKGELSRDYAKRTGAIARGRVELGRYILAGLELLIVSDIVHTALTFELKDLLYLGLLVLIRSMISFFLEREIREIREDLTHLAPDHVNEMQERR